MKRTYATAALAALTAVSLAACGDNSSPSGPETTQAPFTVVMEPQSAASAASIAGSTLAAARLPLSNVTSITLPLGVVEAHTVGSTGSDAWVAAGAVDEDVDLLALPSDGITLVDSSLPEGSYDALRFYLTGDPTITLNQSVQVGRTTFEAGSHTLVIPSADQNGIRLAADFTVDAAGQVLTVLVDDQATVNHVTATGSGRLMIAPVLNVRNQAGEHVGGLDDGAGGSESEAEFHGTVATIVDGTVSLGDGTMIEITDSSEVGGDLLSIAAVQDALDAGEVITAEGEGSLASDGETIVADRIEFEVESEAGNEIRGTVSNVDVAGRSFNVTNGSGTTTVVLTDTTEVDFEDGLVDLANVGSLVTGGTTVYAEVEGTLAGDTLTATEVDFKLDMGMDGGE